MGKFQNLTGKKYGKLTVVEYHKREKWTDSKGNIRYKHYWKCIDDLGNEVIRTGASLRDSVHFAKENKIKDFKGKKIGKLSILEKVEEKQWIDSKGRKRKNIYWKCKCDCGNEVIRTEHSLREERTRSCGCNKINQSKNKKIKENEEEFE